MSIWQKMFGSGGEPKREYVLPEGELVYAIGDIHGRADLLTRLCAKIATDMKSRTFGRATIVFLGDYVDRGFHSCEVIDGLISLQMTGVDTVYLAGNHEDMMLRFLDDPAEGQLWLGVGGLATLASYGVFVSEESDLDALLDASAALAASLPKAHLEFLQNLQEHWRLGDVLFVHAGLRPGIPLEAQRRRDKLGVRREFTDSDFDFGMRVVHGHTGVRKPEVFRGRIAVDTGAFATGVLTAAVMQDGDVSFLNT